jgi:hypothetical protein
MYFLDPFHLENPSVRIWAKKPVQQPSEVAKLSTAKQDRSTVNLLKGHI